MGPKPIDRALTVLIVMVLLVAGWVNWQHRREAVQREKDLLGQDLLRAQQMLSMRIDALFHEWQEDALEEANAVMLGFSEQDLLRRWSAVMGTHWPVISVRLADELGNELALHRLDTAMLLLRTAAGSSDTSSRALRFVDGQAVGDSFIWAPFLDYDPRERIWFSKALENSREAPVWSERQFGDSAQRVVQVCQLVPNSRQGDPYRVLLFDIDLGRATAMDARNPWLARNGLLLINPEGRIYASNREAAGEPMAIVLSKALDQWLPRKFNSPVVLVHEGVTYGVQTGPVELNGLLLYTVLAADMSTLVTATHAERMDIRVGTALMLAMVALLAALAIRRRMRDREARRQGLQLEQMKLRLSKAMGERDVLSREVHHRVKNNLQVVSSLLNLQAGSLKDDQVRQEFLRGKRRIDTIALVHHRLYDQPDLRAVNLNHFLGQLTRSIAGLHDARRDTVSISIQADGLTCDQDTAIELGIIVCELVSNAYQHAFPHATGGHIEVSVSRVEGDLHRLVVSNNGIPPTKGQLTGPGKLGLEIVEALADQLDGSLHVRSEGHPAFEVLFRMRRKAPSTDPLDTDGAK